MPASAGPPDSPWRAGRWRRGDVRRWLAGGADGQQQIARAQGRACLRPEGVAQHSVYPRVGGAVGLAEHAARQMLQRGGALGGFDGDAGIIE